MKERYIKLFEQWQWLNREDSDSNERDYRTTIDQLLTWAIGPDWKEDPSLIADSIQVDDEFLEEDELIGYHETLKRNSDTQIDLYSQLIDGQVDNSWTINDIYFTLITWDWPFETDEEDVTDEEREIINTVSNQLSGDPIMQIANIADIIDWAQSQIRQHHTDPSSLTPTGFKNWFNIQRSSSN
jgi:hypothetical protein